MDEKSIFDTIKSETEKVDIPESIKPENMMDKLGEQISFLGQATEDVVLANRELETPKKVKKPKSKVRMFGTAVAGIAAVVATVIVGVNVRNMYLDHKAESGLYVENQESIFKTLTSYAELEEYIESKNNKLELDFTLGGSKGDAMNSTMEDSMVQNGTGNFPEEEMPTGSTTNDKDESAEDSVVNDGESGSSDYSDTNVRTEGVLEADCIKTDGKYIFALDVKSDYKYEIEDEYIINDYYDAIYEKNVLDIAVAAGADTEYIVQYDLNAMINEKFDDELEIYDLDMILYEDKIIIIGNYPGESGSYNSQTLVAVFNRSDIMDVKLEKCFTVSGAFSQCRMNDGYLYVVSKQRVIKGAIEPQVDGKDMECSDVYISDGEDYNSYLIFTSYNMSGEPQKVDSKAVVNDGGSQLYASADNFYILSTYYKDTLFSGNKTVLCIMKFSYGEGVITPMASAEVDGWLEDVFCIDEYNENLRIVVTGEKNFDEINTLYVLDKELNEIGKIDDIAPGERIYSARFDGDIGYFVTFEQVDPLFSVDLSDPTAPKIIGELKIPGFSEYMHMWSDDRMFGIGEENGYIKLSMFDISDPYNVKEEDKDILENVYYSSALYDHKSILVNGQKNIIGFCAEGFRDYGWMEGDVMYDSYQQISNYYIYKYEDGKFVLKQTVPQGRSYYYNNVRGMYIGDYIYVVTTSGGITVLSMDTFEVLTTATK